MMKTLNTSSRWLFILCIPVLLLAVSTGAAVNSLWLYKYGFEKYAISQSTGLAETELDKAARGLISYFNSGDEYISLNVVKDGQPFALFNQREIIHLKDVKGLIRLDYAVLLVTLLYVSGFSAVRLIRTGGKERRRMAAEEIAWGSGLTLVLMAFLGLSALLGFDRLFLGFHLLSFSNDFWQLDPSRDYLIRLFPQGFWYDATLSIVMSTAATAVILGGVSGRYLLSAKKKSAA